MRRLDRKGGLSNAPRDDAAPAKAIARGKAGRRKRVSFDFQRDRSERSGRDRDRLVLAIERTAHDAVDAQQRTGLRAIAKDDAGAFECTVRVARRTLAENRYVTVVFANDEIELHGLPK
jgi:hypothetical protein